MHLSFFIRFYNQNRPTFLILCTAFISHFSTNMYCIQRKEKGGGTFLLRGVTRVPVGPLGRRMVEAVDQLSCKIEKIGVQSRVRWSRQCRVPPGSRVTATVLGAGQQLGEAWRRASSAASSFGHGRAGLRWQWWWRSGDGDGTAPANFSSLTMYYAKSSAF
jgi:hypothetical protein